MPGYTLQSRSPTTILGLKRNSKPSRLGNETLVHRLNRRALAATRWSNPQRSMMPAIAGKGFFLNDTNTATAVAVANPRERDEAVNRKRTWKPSPCLLTRRELQALIAEQLG
ncbi:MULTISPECIES: hypothetical protein [unclassified Rhizobium]|uniref:hypothetical protein n=1 Tax=unclassified Rhizobium TaxID=2613769 RepID=UPI001179D4F2|nr:MULTISPECIES: hypothetical protein [unclassified Rhizobium]